MADIAQKAGVSTAAVSMALKDHPRISTGMKKRILEICRQEGYSPNPIAKALSQSKKSDGEPRFLGTLAMLEGVVFAKMRNKFTPRDLWNQQLESVCRRMGYKLDFFLVGSSRKEQRTLNRILLSRGISGLLIEGNNQKIHTWDLDWNRFAAVAYSSSLNEHFIHNVMSNSYQDVYDSIVALHERGYRRPGYLSPSDRFYYWSAGLHSALNSCREKQQIPDLILKDFPQRKEDQEKILHWYSRYKPDVIVANMDDPLLDFLAKNNIRIPEDVGFLCLDVWESREHLSGLRQQRQTVYRVAVDLLHGMLMRHECGAPDEPMCIHIPSQWNEGVTLRDQ